MSKAPRGRGSERKWKRLHAGWRVKRCETYNVKREAFTHHVSRFMHLLIQTIGYAIM
jgi:hypothetical protein